MKLNVIKPINDVNAVRPIPQTGPLKFESITLFLNRSCPRDCPQCGIADNSRKPLPVEKWKDALSILRDTFDVKFFLFLGTEPLSFREGLVDLVKWFTDEKLFYGFYTTSPEPLFSRYKQRLLDAGLNNWSSGIDGLAGMDMDDITKKKASESIAGLQWMAERGVQTHTQLTIHKKNLHNAVEILTWCQKNIKGCQSTINMIEWRKDDRFDFFSWPRDMQDLMWEGTKSEQVQVMRVMADIKALSRVPGMKIQTPDAYLDNAYLHYDKLDAHCDWLVGPAVDCDGTLRACGYNTGRVTGAFNVFDLQKPAQLKSFTDAWRRDVAKCSGCHWIWPDMLRGDVRILNPNSGFHEERWTKP